MTSMSSLSRRAALAALGAFALAGLGGCAPTHAPSVQAAGTTSAFHIASMRGEHGARRSPMSAIRPRNGRRIRRRASSRRCWPPIWRPAIRAARRSPCASISIYLGGGGPTDPDTMRGVATLSRGAEPARQTSVHVVLTYIPSPTDQALVEQAFRGRVQALSQAFAYRLKRKWGL